MDRLYVKRTTSYRWNSREELCDYLKEKFDMSQEQIDYEIRAASETFSLRRGEVICTQQLWEKVGRGLENRLMGK